MKRLGRNVLLLCVCMIVLGCTEGPQAMNADEKRVYDALIKFSQSAPDVKKLKINAIGSHYESNYLNIAIELSFEEKGQPKVVDARLVLETGMLVQNPTGHIASLSDHNECMKIKNINYALSQYFSTQGK
jgi:hypothetical protein